MRLLSFLIIMLFPIFVFSGEKSVIIMLDGKPVANEKFLLVSHPSAIFLESYVGILQNSRIESIIKNLEGAGRMRDNEAAVLKKFPRKGAADPNVGYEKRIKYIKDNFANFLKGKIEFVNTTIFRPVDNKSVFLVTTDVNGKFFWPEGAQCFIISYDTELHKDKKYIITYYNGEITKETVIDAKSTKNIMFIDSNIVNKIMNYK